VISIVAMWIAVLLATLFQLYQGGRVVAISILPASGFVEFTATDIGRSVRSRAAGDGRVGEHHSQRLGV
jgi:hypothetical protein